MKFLRLSTATAETASPTRISPIPVQTLAHDSQRCSASWAKRIGGVALIGLSLSLLASGKAEAISLTFEKIVDVNTAIPEGTGNFGFFETPSLDNGNVAFNGLSGDFEQRGVYTNIGSELNVVADTNTPIPGGTGNFTAFGSFFSPSLDDGNVALNGFGGANFDRSGIYTSINGVLDVVADTNTPIPGGTGTFSNSGGPSLDNGNVVFGASDVGGDSIYTNIGGGLSVVADTNTPIPGGTGTFFGFTGNSLDNGTVAFGGFGGANLEQSGIYTNIAGALNVVADTNTPVPGGTGTFRDFFSPSLNDGNVAFQGISGANFDRSGIYTSINGVLDVVADMNTPIPGGTGTFSDFFFPLPSLDNGNVAFASTNAGFEQDGIYTNIGGTLAEVIATGGFLDDKEVSSVFFGSEGLSGNQIAFGATFSDDSQAIYIATAIPEPSSVLGTLAFGAFGAGYMLKRREKKQKLASRDKTAV